MILRSMGATPKVEITIFWQPVSPLILLTQLNGEELVCNIETCKVSSPKSRVCVFHNSVMMNGSTLKKFPGTYNCRYSGELYRFDTLLVRRFHTASFIELLHCGTESREVISPIVTDFFKSRVNRYPTHLYNMRHLLHFCTPLQQPHSVTLSG